MEFYNESFYNLETSGRLDDKLYFENGNKPSLKHVVIQAILEKDNKLLLVKRAENLVERGKWGLPSGFLDRDETAGEGMLRELKEETGWEGKIYSLFSINANPNRGNDLDRQNVPFTFIYRTN